MVPININKNIAILVPIFCVVLHLEIWVPINYNSLNIKQNNTSTLNQITTQS